MATNSIINNAIPGFDNLTSSATGIIQNLLGGVASPDIARAQNANFGAESGLAPDSPFLANRGFDLYGQQAETRKQSGIDNLLKLLAGYSGTVVPTTGQQIQSGQFQQEFNERQRLNAPQQQFFNPANPVRDKISSTGYWPTLFGGWGIPQGA